MPDRIVGPILSTVPALAAAAAATRSLRVGTYVLASGLRNPVLLAREVATLDLVSVGRFELGLGTGVSEDDFRAAGIPYERPGARIDRLAETLGIVKALLAGQEVTTSGAHYQVSAARGYPPPVQQPGPPILIAASGQRLLALAAREADIVALAVGPTGDETVLREKVDVLRREAGERFGQIELHVNLVAVVPEGQPVPPSIRGRVRGMFGIDVDDLIRAQSPFVLTGSTDQMAEQLLGLRERFGISYVAVAEDLMDGLAPVVGRLAGRGAS
jgi:probable F420-dependent oxidoreductase